MPYVDITVTYPVDFVYTEDELETIDMYKTDFENTVAEQEVYRAAYDRYVAAE